MMAVIDLKVDMPLGHAGPLWRPAHEQRTDHLRPTHRAPADPRVPQVRRPLPGQSQGQDLLLLGPVPVHGLCPVDLPRESARHRGLPADAPGGGSITWAFAARSRAARWPTPTRPATGGSTPTSPRCSSPRLARCTSGDDLGLDLENTVYALDSTTIDLCMSLFPWAHYKSDQHAIKLHTLLDLRGNIPTVIRITPAQLHDVHFLDHLVLEPGAFYVMDRGYLDFARLYRWTAAGAFFVTRARKNFRFQRLVSHPVEDKTDWRPVRPDDLAAAGSTRPRAIPAACAASASATRSRSKKLVFLTNNFTLPAQTIADLYRSRWQVELFFKWIKQHLRIKAFYGTSPNAVKTQVWIAVCAYVLVAIVKKRLNLELNLYTILQILSVTLFEKTPILQAFSEAIVQD